MGRLAGLVSRATLAGRDSAEGGTVPGLEQGSIRRKEFGRSSGKQVGHLLGHHESERCRRGSDKRGGSCCRGKRATPRRRGGGTRRRRHRRVARDRRGNAAGDGSATRGCSARGTGNGRAGHGNHTRDVGRPSAERNGTRHAASRATARRLDAYALHRTRRNAHRRADGGRAWHAAAAPPCTC